MKQISERISINREPDSLTVKIKAFNVKWKESILVAWVAMWTFCGVYFIYELFNYREDNAMAIFLGIMVGFWLYFEIRVVKALLWRLYGVEVVEFTPDGIYYKAESKWPSKPKQLSVSNIKKFDEYVPSANNFFAFMSRSYWIIGGETIEVKNVSTDFYIARELSDKEINHLVPILNRALEDFRRKKK
ncbi:MAG: hypothetical protein ACXITV_13020 [Luteibaculaceae bacterium]